MNALIRQLSNHITHNQYAPIDPAQNPNVSATPTTINSFNTPESPEKTMHPKNKDVVRDDRIHDDYPPQSLEIKSSESPNKEVKIKTSKRFDINQVFGCLKKLSLKGSTKVLSRCHDHLKGCIKVFSKCFTSLFDCIGECCKAVCELIPCFCMVFGGIVSVLSILAVFGLIITLFVLSAQNRYDRTTADNATNELTIYINASITSQAIPPITDIQLVSSSSSCPVGYDSILLDQWPGTSNGCSCPDGGLSSGICQEYTNCEPDPYANSVGCYSEGDDACTDYNVQPYTCTTVDPIANGCTDVSAIAEIDIPSWDSMIWCVTTISIGTDYIKTSPCPTGFTECWAGHCIRDTLNCPVTNIILSDAFVNTDSKVYGASKYYTLFREPGKPPLINITLSNNNIPCRDPHKEPQGSQYVLLNDYLSQCDNSDLDTEFSFKLQENTQEQVLRESNFPPAVFNLPRYLSYLQSTETYLVGRRMMSISGNIDCYNVDLSKSDKLANEYDSFYYGTNMPLFFAIGVTVFMVCVMIGSASMGGPKGAIVPFFILFLITTVLTIVAYALAHKHAPKIQELREYLFYVQENCFLEGASQKLMLDVAQSGDDNTAIIVKLALSLMIMSISLYVLSLIGGIIFLANS